MYPSQVSQQNYDFGLNENKIQNDELSDDAESVEMDQECEKDNEDHEHLLPLFNSKLHNYSGSTLNVKGEQ